MGSGYDVDVGTLGMAQKKLKYGKLFLFVSIFLEVG